MSNRRSPRPIAPPSEKAELVELERKGNGEVTSDTRKKKLLQFPVVPAIGTVDSSVLLESQPSPRNLGFKLSPIKVPSSGRKLKETQSLYGKQSFIHRNEQIETKENEDLSPSPIRIKNARQSNYSQIQRGSDQQGTIAGMKRVQSSVALRHPPMSHASRNRSSAVSQQRPLPVRKESGSDLHDGSLATSEARRQGATTHRKQNSREIAQQGTTERWASNVDNFHLHLPPPSDPGPHGESAYLDSRVKHDNAEHLPSVSKKHMESQAMPSSKTAIRSSNSMFDSKRIPSRRKIKLVAESCNPSSKAPMVLPRASSKHFSTKAEQLKQKTMNVSTTLEVPSNFQVPSPKGSKDDTFASTTHPGHLMDSVKRIGSQDFSPLHAGSLESSQMVHRQRSPNNGLKALAAQANANRTRLKDVRSGQTTPKNLPRKVKTKSLEKDAKPLVVGTGYGVFKDKWVRKGLIGRGQFGEVYLAEVVNTKSIVAVKQMRIQSASMLEEMIQEVEITCRASFRNENVVMCHGWSLGDDTLPKPMQNNSSAMSLISSPSSFEGSWASRSQRGTGPEASYSDLNEFAGNYDPQTVIGKIFNVFMEYLENGSLASVVESRGPLNEVMLRNYTRQLLLGIRSLHAAGIAHRDIKCQNLLLGKDNVLKVADFGSAKRVAHETLDNKSSVQGSVPWMPPEVIRQEVGKSVSENAMTTQESGQLSGWKKADIWSIGCTVIEMATGKPPWHGYSNPATLMYAIASCTEPPKPPKSLHPDCQHFLSLCFNINPKERPPVSQLIYHDYLRPENVDGDGVYCNKSHKWI